ncbi:MAG: hypothetical protein ACRCYK_01355 [Aeromonas hydrophila]
MAGSSGGLQQQTVTSVQKEEALASLLPWLAQGQLQQEACDELQANHAALQALATSPKPFWPAIGALAGSVRAILESAGGGVLAGQALSWLATLSAS